MEPVIDLKGKLLPIAGEFSGIHIKKARPLIVERLKSKGLVEKIEEHYVHRIATDSRGGGIIEPQILRQWFIAVDKPFTPRSGTTTLKKLMRSTVESGSIKIFPDHFEKIYYNWIDNLHDWCISRQIWFGHQIPVWYQGEKMFVGLASPGDGWEQDSDTLDTWFSSGLWPFSVFNWPEETRDLATYFPNSVLETGYDILFFWVARMILMAHALTDSVPFRKVYLHGLVRDAKGRKMSKSLGNGIDPLEMADKYGADATRLSLIIGASAGSDLKLSEDRIRGYRNFSTKIWNIARFIQMNKPEGKTQLAHDKRTEELDALKKEVSAHIEAFEFHLAGEKLYHYIWHTLADVIIEEEKKKLRDGTPEEKAASYALLEHLLLGSLVMLHPFMPFITEEVYQIFRPGTMLMVERWE